MITLAVNVSRSVGLRGVDELQQPFDGQGSLVIMADHSSQIGPEKVLLALGVNAAAMPAPGKALTHEHVCVLTVKPGDSWKTADMEREYGALADRHGTPRAVVVDGAVELREGLVVQLDRSPAMRREQVHQPQVRLSPHRNRADQSGSNDRLRRVG